MANGLSKNQVLEDSTFSIVDNGDNTKILQFQCSGITAGNTRTITIPDSDGTLALTSGVPATPISLANGGTAANLTASNGGVVYSGAAAFAVLAGTATAGQILRSGSSSAPAWSTATYPATTTINRILYSSAANVVGEITTANNAVLVTSSGGVPSIAAPAANLTVSSSVLDTVQGIQTSSTPQFARLGLGQAADSSAVMAATGQYFSTQFTTTTTLNWNNGNVQYIQLTNGSQTFTFSNPKSGGRYILILKQPSSGAAGTVSWPTISWQGGSTPTLTATNNKVDLISLIYDGTNAVYYGTGTLNY